MEETANMQANETQDSAEVKETKTFTQDELNQIVSERVKKERQKFEGFDEIKDKAAKYEKLQEESKSDLQKAEEEAARLKQELDSMKSAEKLRQIKAEVSAKSGIPESLLTGATEEACEEQAKAIKDFVDKKIEEAKANGYPMVRDGGEVSGHGKASTSQQFADWMKKNMA